MLEKNVQFEAEAEREASGELDHVIHMAQPIGFENKEHRNMCKLKKAVYGLKQLPSMWFGKDCSTCGRVKMGTNLPPADANLFVKYMLKTRFHIHRIEFNTRLNQEDDFFNLLFRKDTLKMNPI
ncbi:hypothetical protein QVD17_23409 [Tagetes erecta]|uniref:Reverse transcriptase Ty1/copia-type domain-containing protein n=1 Tax=Tagetes erecta TaxID=13708 RepID=A0AAD8KEG0_TARER|nr:hypothetical protein QVD17_23409 [Tagetes erecta]